MPKDGFLEREEAVHDVVVLSTGARRKVYTRSNGTQYYLDKEGKRRTLAKNQRVLPTSRYSEILSIALPTPGSGPSLFPGLPFYTPKTVIKSTGRDITGTPSKSESQRVGPETRNPVVTTVGGDPLDAALEVALDPARLAKGAADLETRITRLKALPANNKAPKNLDTTPVYLGFVPELKNESQDYSTAQMRKRLLTIVKGLGSSGFRYSALAPYFDLETRLVRVPFDIDHILAKAWGGPDHARNYMIMPVALNRSLGALPITDPTKLAYIVRRGEGSAVLRTLRTELQAYKGWSGYKASRKEYFRSSAFRAL